MTRRILASALLFFIANTGLTPMTQAQQLPVNDMMTDYLRILQLNDQIPLQNGAASSLDHMQDLDSLTTHPWANREAPEISSYSAGLFEMAPYDIKMQNYWQSLEPFHTSDGPVWQGRGFTNSLSGGFYMRYGILSASVRPVLTFNQNRSFSLSPFEGRNERSAYAYPLGNIDWPQRYGDDPFWNLFAGESYIRADYHGWGAGLSNELMWWSPAWQNALLLSSNAPGFPHFFIGTTEPKNIGIGHLQTKLLWGKLQESDYFDSNPDNNERYITGGRISFTPKPIPGLTVGINRIYYETIPPEGIPVGDLLKVFESFTKVNLTGTTNPGGNDQADQLLSLFGSWKFPESGLQIYGEWARTDHSWNWRDFITEPEHSRGYTIGLAKVFTLSKQKLLSINAELTQLEANKTGQFRPYPTFYVHGRTQQGYSHQGQLLGASIGPGSSSQYIGASLYFPKGKLNLWTQRIALNNDFLYQHEERIKAMNPDFVNSYWLHNIEMRLGSSVTYFYKKFETELGFVLRRELNDDYMYKDDQFHLGIKFSIRYRLSDMR